MSELGRFYPGHHAQERPDAPALIEASTGKTLTYCQLDHDAWRVAHYYRSLGLNVGDAVAFWLGNCLEYVELMWGAIYAGLYYTPISTELQSGEIAYIVRDSGARALIVTTALSAEIRSDLRSALADVAVVEVNAECGLPESIRSESVHPLDNPCEGVPLLYSSGTTGRPKGIKLTQSKGILGTRISPLANLLTDLFSLDAQARYLSPAPLYHVSPMGWVLAIGQIGATVAIMRKFEAGAFLDHIERYRITHTQVVPTMLSRLLQLPESTRNATDVSSLTCVIHAAAPCPVAVKYDMFEWLGPIIHEYYAGSEAAGFTYCSPQDWLSHPGSVGRSLLGPVHILNDDGDEVPSGAEGLVYFETPRQFEYVGDSEKTRRAFNERGWGTFGDVGYVDADGFLYLTDRRTDLIISGGVNVYPRETEETLLKHQAVFDAAVVGLPDDDLGQRVTAVVSLREGWVQSPELENDLIAHCRKHISHVKCPRKLIFTDKLPRADTGKLLRRRVRDEIRAPSKGASSS
jgi:long-chain acyl-CoA synthetase